MKGRIDQQQYSQRLRVLLEPICRVHGVALYDARMTGDKTGTILRVMIERTDADTGSAGVTLAECQVISRDISAALDVHEEVAPTGKYRLEVGSPGLDRPLFTLEQFQRFVDHEVRIETRTAVAGRRRFRGRLTGADHGRVQLLDHDGQAFELPHDQITKANLVYKL